MTCFEELSISCNSIKKFDCAPCYAYDYFAQLSKLDVNFDFGKEIAISPCPNVLFMDHFFSLPDVVERKCTFLYTDGSKNDLKGPVGFAIWSTDDRLNRKFKVNNTISIFTAEALAILEAVKLIIDFKITSSIIFSDLKSVLASLSNSNRIKNQSYVILEIKKLCVYARQNDLKICVVWIPAHVGINGNEKADREAKLVIIDGMDYPFSISVSDAVAINKEVCTQKISANIENLGRSKGKEYFLLYYRTSPIPWFQNFKLTRKEIVIINRLRSNHSSLNHSLNKFKIVNSGLCECGKENDTADHLLWHCTLFNNIRNIMMENLIILILP